MWEVIVHFVDIGRIDDHHCSFPNNLAQHSILIKSLFRTADMIVHIFFQNVYNCLNNTIIYCVGLFLNYDICCQHIFIYVLLVLYLTEKHNQWLYWITIDIWLSPWSFLLWYPFWFNKGNGKSIIFSGQNSVDFYYSSYVQNGQYMVSWDSITWTFFFFHTILMHFFYFKYSSFWVTSSHYSTWAIFYGKEAKLEISHLWRVMVLNTFFNNISVISWRSVLLVEETSYPEKKHHPSASHWQTWSHNVVSSTYRHEHNSNSKL
jgi:hypothetical protein